MNNNNDETDIELLDENQNETEYININNDNAYQQESSGSQKQISKSERDAKAMENFNNTAAEVAKKSGNPYVKAAGHIHSGLNKVTNGKYGELTGKVTAKANKSLGPAGRVVQRGANRLNGSINDENSSSFADKKFQNRANNAIARKNQLNNYKSENAGEEQGKESVAKQATNVAKEKAKQQIKEKAKNAIIKFFASNPWAWIILGGIVVLFFLIILFAGVLENSNSETSKYGLAGYNYYHIDNLCETVHVWKKDKEGNYISADVDFEKEYIPGVINAEIGYFANNIDMGKLFAIAARSFALSMLGDDCTIEGTANRQAFTFDKSTRDSIINNPDSPIMQAVNETYGLVFVKNGKLQTGYFDAACYRSEDEDNYYLGYGSLTLGGEHLQAIPKSWAETQSGLMGYINDAKANGLCYHNHGYGISTYGAKYLAEEQNYNYEQLLKYYYGDGELRSIYENNYNSVTSSGTNDILTMELSKYLETNGTSIEAFNEFILSEIIKSGFGTRGAVVAAATSLVAGLYENYQARLPYTMCGQHYCANMYNQNNENVNRGGTSFFGVDPNWGALIHNSSDGLYHYSEDAVYTRYGPDCSGFVSWALHNAGFDNEVMTADTFGYLGERKALAGTRVANPGDLIHSEGHIMLVVGVDDSKKVYLIAHAAGGSQGVKINELSFTQSGFYAVDMTSWYSKHQANINVDAYRAGYIGGYTGADSSTFKRSTLDKGVYFVGDSRTVGMCYVAKLCSDTENCVNSSCNAKIGSSYSWFKNQRSAINTSSKGNVVIAMGVNDLVNKTENSSDIDNIAKKYFDEFEIIARNNSSKIIYITSVNPVTSGSVVKPLNVAKYNSKMRELISNSSLSNLKYINTFDNINYEIEKDGIHYSFNTYQRMYDYLIGVL